MLSAVARAPPNSHMDFLIKYGENMLIDNISRFQSQENAKDWFEMRSVRNSMASLWNLDHPV